MNMFVIYKQFSVPFFRKSIKIPLILWKKTTTPHLVVVQKIKPQLECPYERKLLEVLHTQNFYVSPFSLTHRLEVPLALIPFRVALINHSHPAKKTLEKAIARLGWQIVYYETDELKRDFYEVIRRIHSITSIKTLC